MAAVLNPTTFSITDAAASAQTVTTVTIMVGTTAGGPYPNAFQLTASETTAGLASGTFTGTLASIGEHLGPGLYFAVATARTPQEPRAIAPR
jgi:hypothetical protein